MQSTGVSNISAALAGVVPALRYKDVRAASAWLCAAFGFEQHRLIEDADGSVRYAQLACGSSMIMLCPVGGSAFDAYMVQPSDAQNRETQACYIYVPDALAHKSRALEAGAELVLDIDAGKNGGQGYSCRDLEGHIWSFGTFNPWRGVEQHEHSDAARQRPHVGALAAAVIATAIACVGVLSWLRTEQPFSASLARIEDTLEKPADLESAERMLRQARADLVRERSLRMQAETAGRDAAEAGRRDRAVVRLAQRFTREDAQPETGIRPDRPTREVRTATDAGGGVIPMPMGTASVPSKIETTVTPVRVASNTGSAGDELSALRRAVELAQAQLKEEREQRNFGSATLREQLDRERAAREAAERTAREARAKVARIEALRRAEFEKTGGAIAGGYRDMSREVFRSR